MKQLKHIIHGWWLFLTDDKKTYQLSKKRMDICKPCDQRKKQFCGDCGCFLPAKTRIEEEVCPISKW